MTSCNLIQGKKAMLIAETIPAVTEYKDVLSLIWESNYPDIVECTSEKTDGQFSQMIQAKKPGTATITVTITIGVAMDTPHAYSNSFSASCEVTVKGEGEVLANMDSFWYGSTFNRIEEKQCPWYVIGRIGEVYNVRISFSPNAASPGGGNGDGGWWVENANDKAYVWKDGSGQTDKYRTITTTWGVYGIEPGCAASFNWYDGNNVNYGHVVYVENVELIAGETYVYYSESYKGMSNADVGKVKKVAFNDFINLYDGLKGYVKIK